MPSDAVRAQICDYLAAGRPLLEGMETSAVLALEGSDYVARMRRHNTWGGAIEIQAACNLWNARICVEDRRGRRGAGAAAAVIEFLPVAGTPSTTLRIWWNGGHYEPIRREGGGGGSP
jgi:hypothetical protein